MTTVQISVLVGVLLPLVTSVLNQTHWSSQRKQIVAIVVSVIAGSATLFASDAHTDWRNFGAVVALVYAASQATYALIWKPTGVAPAIENATTKTDPVAVVVAVPDPAGKHEAPDDTPVVAVEPPKDAA